MTVMLYKTGKENKLHGYEVDYVIVEENQVDECLANGWYRTPKEADDAFVESLEKTDQQTDEDLITALREDAQAKEEQKRLESQLEKAKRAAKKED